MLSLGAASLLAAPAYAVPSEVQAKKETKTVTVKYDPAKTDEATLAKALEKLGYKVENVEL